MIIDQVRLHLKSGSGGGGSSVFVRRGDKPIPDGGDGGRGADIIISANQNLYDLNKFRHSRKFTAPSGEPGKSANKAGRAGQDLVLSVPLGTLIRDDQGLVLADLAKESSSYRAVIGGEGGKGNFKRGYTEEAGPSEEKDIVLDYRIPNDIAFVGYANTGRTSLFNALSGQEHKVAEYPYTTTSCSWAVCSHGFSRFVAMDTPPLKESALLTSQDEFVKHLFRTRVIAIVSDDFSACQDQARLIKEKLRLADIPWGGKNFFYLLNKVDRIEAGPGKKDWIFVSAKTGAGMDQLKDKILAALK